PFPHNNWSSSLNSLAITLEKQFKQMNQLHDLKESISLYREALVLRPLSSP
ncbi:hypothetical protein L208DRAFT_1127451, partial [Tricholoma matsutake]